MVGSRSSRDVNSSRAWAARGLAPSPPAKNTRKPGSTVPSSLARLTAMIPTSLNIAWPQSVAQPEKLILNLRGRRCAYGLRRKYCAVASAQGEMSSTSYGQAPDLGHLLQLDEVELDVLARREVTPAARVVLGDIGEHLELLRRHPAVRH